MAADPLRLISLGVPDVLAVELARQINAGGAGGGGESFDPRFSLMAPMPDASASTFEISDPAKTQDQKNAATKAAVEDLQSSFNMLLGRLRQGGYFEPI